MIVQSARLCRRTWRNSYDSTLSNLASRQGAWEVAVFPPLPNYVRSAQRVDLTKFLDVALTLHPLNGRRSVKMDKVEYEEL